MSLSDPARGPRKAIESASRWAEETLLDLRGLLRGGASSSGRPQVSDGTRVGMLLDSLLDRWRERPSDHLLSFSGADSKLEKVQLLEDLVEEVLRAAGFSLVENEPAAKRATGKEATSFLEGIRADISREALDSLGERVLAELGDLRESAVEAKAIAGSLTSAQARWLRALGDIEREGHDAPTHRNIAVLLGIKTKSSENRIRDFRPLDLVKPPPKRQEEHLGLTELGWHVWAHLPPL